MKFSVSHKLITHTISTSEKMWLMDIHTNLHAHTHCVYIFYYFNIDIDIDLSKILNWAITFQILVLLPNKLCCLVPNQGHQSLNYNILKNIFNKRKVVVVSGNILIFSAISNFWGNVLHTKFQFIPSTLTLFWKYEETCYPIQSNLFLLKFNLNFPGPFNCFH